MVVDEPKIVTPVFFNLFTVLCTQTVTATIYSRRWQNHTHRFDTQQQLVNKNFWHNVVSLDASQLAVAYDLRHACSPSKSSAQPKSISLTLL